MALSECVTILLRMFETSPPPEQGPPSEPKSAIRRLLKYSWLLIAAAAVYSGLTLYSRWDADRRAAEESRQKQLEADRRTFENLGGDRFEILHFYASPPVLRRGESAQLCYGASNAKAVRLDPYDRAVWPSLNRCLSVTPARTTTYTLTIEDGQGNSRNATLTLQVE